MLLLTLQFADASILLLDCLILARDDLAERDTVVRYPDPRQSTYNDCCPGIGSVPAFGAGSMVAAAAVEQ
jgi:hypothetical protein